MTAYFANFVMKMKKNLNDSCYIQKSGGFQKENVYNAFITSIILLLISFKFNLLDGKVSLDLESRRADVAYLSDIFKKLNEVNIKLQGTNMCLIKAKGIIMTFIGKLDFYKNCLLRLDLNQFPSLKAVQENQTDDSFVCQTVI